ncbi:MAG: hypothetical protein U1F76_28305 [Candidatus Competibacteraceae bacterium]
MSAPYVMLKRAVVTTLEWEVASWSCLWERAPPGRRQPWTSMIGLEGRCSQAMA